MPGEQIDSAFYSRLSIYASVTTSPGHALVVGAGIFGLATSLELRTRGWAVTLLDPGPLPHKSASSTDVSKMVRMDYGSDLFYHEFAEAALEGWDRWNADWPYPPYHETGLLVFSGEEIKPGSFEYESAQALQERGYEPEWLVLKPNQNRFPTWEEGQYSHGYLSPRAGWVESGFVVSHLLTLAQKVGVDLRIGTAQALAEEESQVTGVLLKESGEYLAADTVVVCAGAWTPSLLPWLSDRMWSVGQPVVHLGTDQPEIHRGKPFPPWFADTSSSGWYGFPALPDGHVKIGCHGPGLTAHPDTRGAVAREHLEALRAFLEKAMPSLAKAPVLEQRVCMYCDTFDGDFLIDQDPNREGLIVAGGGSGHGFKFAPVIGGVVADVVEGRDNRWAKRFKWRDPPTQLATGVRYTINYRK